MGVLFCDFSNIQLIVLDGATSKKISYAGALFGLIRTPIRLHESDGFLGRLGASSPVLSSVSQAEDRRLSEFVRIHFPFPTFFFTYVVSSGANR